MPSIPPARRGAIPPSGHTLPGLALAALLLAAPAAAQTASGPEPDQGSVTIYRCSDSQGRLLALRDSPCRPGERQELVRMQRPQDPPPQPARPAPAATPAPAPGREVRIVTVQTPQPMYECTAPDGTTYLSGTDAGNARWVPFWAVAYPHRPHPRPPAPPPGGGHAPPAGPRPPHTGVVVPAGGTWVRDPCVLLPPEELCRRLSDRRYEILRRYHDTTPSERQALDREQRDIDMRMQASCPGY